MGETGEGEGGVEERFLESVTRVKIERKKIKEATRQVRICLNLDLTVCSS